MGPGGPGFPTGPGEPLSPFSPSYPTRPSKPRSPFSPGKPGRPCIPGSPFSPLTLIVGPGGPRSPFSPNAPGIPGRPTEPYQINSRVKYDPFSNKLITLRLRILYFSYFLIVWSLTWQTAISFNAIKTRSPWRSHFTLQTREAKRPGWTNVTAFTR